MSRKERIVSAVFANHADAEQCINDLRLRGIPNNAISIIARHEGEVSELRPDGSNAIGHTDSRLSGTAKGAVVGASVGALFGLAAFFIPGVGPFVTAGSLASSLGTAGGAAASGAVVGVAAGGLAGAIMDYGVPEEEACYYEERVRAGGVVILVDTSKTPQGVQLAPLLAARGGSNMAYLS